MRELYSLDRIKGYLHADGMRIVNGEGEQVILRGWGMGNWDNPEGFMIGASSLFELHTDLAPMGRMDRGRSLEQIVRETCGSRYLETFWDRWHRAWLGEADIRLLAERGYNSVRLPIRACSFLKEEPGIEWNEESFRMLTDVLDWCEKYRIYAIIDLHAATAGQSCLPCDDGVDNAPHFFIDEEAIERMLILMEEFGRRYENRWIVGAYDCINEPLSMTPRMFELLPVLQDFYQEMVRRFRSFDTKHMILLNGTQFSSRIEAFDRDYDPICHNWGIAIHAYSMVSADVASFADVFARCEELNVPLWMGETGSLREYMWQTTLYEMLANRGVGYNLWCFKTHKGTNAAGVMSFVAPEEWHLITDYALRGGPKPSFEKAQRIFDEYLEAVRFENCVEDTSYHPYLLREGDFEIPAVGYEDLPAESRHCNERALPVTKYRQADGMKIVFEDGYAVPNVMFGARNDEHICDHMLLQLNAGEFASYMVRNPGEYSVSVSYSADASCVVRMTAGDGCVAEITLAAAAQERPAAGEKSVCFPNEPAANKLAVAELGFLSGEHLIRIETVSGSIKLGKVIVREIKK